MEKRETTTCAFDKKGSPFKTGFYYFTKPKKE